MPQLTAFYKDKYCKLSNKKSIIIEHDGKYYLEHIECLSYKVVICCYSFCRVINHILEVKMNSFLQFSVSLSDSS